MSSVVLRCCSINKRKCMRLKLFTPSIRFVSTIGDHMKSMHPDIEIPKAHMVEFVMKDFGNWHDKIAIDDDVIPNGAINYDDLLHMKTDLPDVVAVDDEQVICLPYSSGTTGLPKGVMLTNRNLVANLAQHDIPAIQYAVKASNNHQEVLALVLPMYHIYGFTVSTLSLLKVGCKLITIPKFKRNTYLEVLARHKPTILHIVPPLVTFITTHPGVKTEYFQRLKITLCAAAPLGAPDEDKFRAVVAKPTKIIQAYGMTETSPMAFITPHALEGKCSGTFGHPVSNTLIKVVHPDDPTLRHLGPHQPGEILIKGPQVMKGYYKNSTETESAFVNGWYRTGDVAKYDENEMFFITDRIKELIKVKGFQVAPFELEAIIKNFPGVLESAVIGIPHEYLGESPRAYVVQKPGEKVNTEELIQFVRSKVAKHKNLVGGVVIVDRIPKNPSGKILRRQLRSLY
ncbi:long-chain-fatty-acid--coa ligase [Holotrichia oblita]|uniref:Long-chain-fatty-acid--coa ligase n=1 Tax=Holotrichia oblita TaxID=644536 RepID=A0ACB9TUX1_HOLOL|nr:long-chain-fatty-acid--coa ligase [Holotrichia oblita]